MKRPVFFVIMLAIPALFLLAGAAVLLPRITYRLRPRLMQFMADRLTEDVRRSIQTQLVVGPAFWDAVPDPDVAGLGQRNKNVAHTGAEARLNNAGLRASRPYSARPDSVFRILCVGDSFVFGMGGAEEDRFCDQLEVFYRRHNVRVQGRPIDTYAIGLPGWTLVQEATYLATRLTSYDPDLIVVLSVANDITDNFGVTGMGGLADRFSPENRALGSAVFTIEQNAYFGDSGDRAALAWDLSPESRRRWDKAMQRLERLVELQQGRGKQILVSAMVWGPNPEQPDPFAALFQSHYARRGIPAPFAMVSLRVGPQTTLLHDRHPNRLGHASLRDQYVDALHRLGWVTVPDSAVPTVDRRAPVRLNPALDAAPYQRFRQRLLNHLKETIDFTALRPQETRAFLGGIYPESYNPAQALESAPWGSLRAAFLLRRPQDRPLRGVAVEIEIPPLPELFPFSLRLLLDGAAAGETRFERPNETGRYRISGAPTVPAFYDQVVEVMLETSSYFSTIGDPRMQSYRLLNARAF